MREFRVLLSKEFKSLDVKKYFMMILLLSVMLFSFTIARLGQLEVHLGLNIDGLGNLIKTIANGDGKEAFMSLVLLNTVIFPMIVMNLYLGFPYLLSFYQNNKINGSLIYLMTVPSKLTILVLCIAFFGYLKCIMAVFFIQVIALLILQIFTHELLITIPLIVVAILFQLVIFVIYVIVNSLIWIFNGSKAIINVLRIGMLIGLILVMPVLKFVPFFIIKPAIWMVVVSCIAILFFFIAIYLVKRFYSKEKLILN